MLTKQEYSKQTQMLVHELLYWVYEMRQSFPKGICQYIERTLKILLLFN